MKRVLAILCCVGACASPPQAQQKPPTKPAPKEAQLGPCRIESKSELMMCTQQYDPVCGCDGKTYGNACTAAQAGIQRHRPGRCQDQKAPDG